MLGYGYCAIYRNGEITEELKKSLEKKKAEFKAEMEARERDSKKVIDFVTRAPLRM